MSIGLYTITTRATGTVITAAIYNADHQNHVTNQNPEETGAYSDNIAQMQVATDPGGLGTEVLAGSLAGELASLRAMFIRTFGQSQWYAKLASALAGGFLQVASGGANMVPIESYITATGTSDALAIAFNTLTASAPYAGLTFQVKAIAANLTTTPTIALNSGSPVTITKNGGQALVAGDIFGAGHLLQFKCTSPTNVELLNPAVVNKTATSQASTGSFVNLIGSGPGSAKTATWSCDSIVASTALGGTGYSGNSLTISNLMFNGGGTGIGGMDTGATPTSGALYIYAAYNPTTNTWGVFGTTNGSGSTIYGGANAPSGYTATVLIWSGITDGSGNIQKFNQQDRRIVFPKINALAISSSLPTTYTEVSISTICPPNAKTIGGIVGGTIDTQPSSIAIASDSTGTNEMVFALSDANLNTLLDSFFQASNFSGLMLTVSQNIYYKSASSGYSARIDINGFTF